MFETKATTSGKTLVRSNSVRRAGSKRRTCGNQGEENDFRPNVVDDSGLELLCRPCQKKRFLCYHWMQARPGFWWSRISLLRALSFKADGTTRKGLVVSNWSHDVLDDLSPKAISASGNEEEVNVFILALVLSSAQK